jgi:hypothetical protein
MLSTIISTIDDTTNNTIDGTISETMNDTISDDGGGRSAVGGAGSDIVSFVLFEYRALYQTLNPKPLYSQNQFFFLK